MAAPGDPADEQENIDLPPLDADDDEPEREWSLEDFLPHVDEGDDDPLEDAAAADLDIGAEVDVANVDEDSRDIADDDALLDIGALDDGMVTTDEEFGD